MQITKSFIASASRGEVTFTTKRLVPFPITINSAVLELDSDAYNAVEKNFSVSMNGEVVSSGRGVTGENFNFAPKIKLPRGFHTLTVTSGPYADGVQLEGKVKMQISLFT